ncbi:MAG: hypothetical protein WAT81_01670 [Candidatus Moraniibacteriota bacterium]
MAIELFKGMFKEISVLEILNLFQMSSMQGMLEKVGISKKSGNSASSQTSVAEEGGKGNVDEHNALIALAEAHFGKSLNDMDMQEYAVTRTRFSKLMAIFKALREQGKTGGAEKLMHIIGHESHLHGTQATARNAQGHKPEGQPQRIDLINVRQRTNPAGQLIIRFLTDLEIQEAVDLLVATSITDNGKDKTAAAAKAAKDKADEIWDKMKSWYSDNDSRIHVVLATIATNRETVNRILASPTAVTMWTAVETAATPEEKRVRHETFQAFLLQRVRDFQNPDNPAIARHQAREAGQATPEERARKDAWLTKLLIGIITGGLIILGVAAKLNLNP